MLSDLLVVPTKGGSHEVGGYLRGQGGGGLLSDEKPQKHSRKGNFFVRGTPPKRPKLEMAIDEKRWENLRDRPIQTIIYHETGDLILTPKSVWSNIHK